MKSWRHPDFLLVANLASQTHEHSRRHFVPHDSRAAPRRRFARRCTCSPNRFGDEPRSWRRWRKSNSREGGRHPRPPDRPMQFRVSRSSSHPNLRYGWHALLLHYSPERDRSHLFGQEISTRLPPDMIRKMAWMSRSKSGTRKESRNQSVRGCDAVVALLGGRG